MGARSGRAQRRPSLQPATFCGSAACEIPTRCDPQAQPTRTRLGEHALALTQFNCWQPKRETKQAPGPAPAAW